MGALGQKGGPQSCILGVVAANIGQNCELMPAVFDWNDFTSASPQGSTRFLEIPLAEAVRGMLLPHPQKMSRYWVSPVLEHVTPSHSRDGCVWFAEVREAEQGVNVRGTDTDFENLHA